MPRPRFQNAPAELRSAILEAAAREFGRRGYEAASLNRIIASASLSKGSFYYYFDDKADLAATALVHVMTKLMPPLNLEAVVDAPSFWATMDEFQRQTLAPLADDPSQLQIITQFGTAYVDHPELAAKVLPLISDINQVALAAWRRGQEVGAVRKDLPVELLMAVLTGTKEALLRAQLPRDRALTLQEIAALNTLQLGFMRRLSMP